MNDPTVYWASFWSGFGVGMLTAILISAATTGVIVYLLRNYGYEECHHSNVVDLEQYR